MTKRVVHQPVAKGHDAVREIVLREPGHYPLLLHVWTACNVHDQVSQVLPVPVKIYIQYPNVRRFKQQAVLSKVAR